MKYLKIGVCMLLTVSISSFAQTKKTPAKPVAKKVVAPAATATVKLTTEVDSVAYGIGMNIARNLKSQGLEALNVNLLVKGLQDVLKSEKGLMDDLQCNAVLGKYFERMQASKQAEEAKKYEPNKAIGENFLVENKKKTGIVTLPSGLQYEIMKAGDGAKPTATDKVKTHYHGTLIDGTVFDSSVERGQPAEFPVGGVIQGWVEALQLMPVGSKWKLFVPYNLAYGERAAGPAIKPYSTLIFEVELLEIMK